MGHLKQTKEKIMNVLIMALILSSTTVRADDYVSSSSKGSLTFEAVGKPAMIKIKGESPAPGSILIFNKGLAKIESTLELSQLNTGIDLRDEHMKEKYLETKKYPQAKLVIEKLAVPESFEVNDQEFSGILALHGKEAPVKGIFTMTKERIVEAEFKIKLTDYGIEIPEYMGIKIAETVNVKTKIQFEKK